MVARSRTYTHVDRGDDGVAAAYNTRESLARAASASKGGWQRWKTPPLGRSHGAALGLLAVPHNAASWCCASTKSKESAAPCRPPAARVVTSFGATRSGFSLVAPFSMGVLNAGQCSIQNLSFGKKHRFYGNLSGNIGKSEIRRHVAIYLQDVDKMSRYFDTDIWISEYFNFYCSPRSIDLFYVNRSVEIKLTF